MALLVGEGGPRGAAGAPHADAARLGKAVQLDPIKPTMKAPGIKLLKLKYDKPLSNFAFKFNLRHYNSEHNIHKQRQLRELAEINGTIKAGAYTRPLFSSN